MLWQLGGAGEIVVEGVPGYALGASCPVVLQNVAGAVCHWDHAERVSDLIALTASQADSQRISGEAEWRE